MTLRALAVAGLMTVGPALAAAQGFSSFGAIYFSPESGQAGTATGLATQEEAVTAAREDCSAKGPDCFFAVWMQSACGAVAADGQAAWGADWGVTRPAARENALARCQDSGGEACAVVVDLCSE